MKIIIILISTILILSCKTVDFEEANKQEPVVLTKDEEKELFVEQEMKVNDISKSVILLEPPEVRSVDELEIEKDDVRLVGNDALEQNLKDKTVLPEYVNGRLKGWLYKEDSVYEILCQTYHSTLIQFEPGEEMLEMPYISEPEVWRISRGIGVKEGIPTQHLVVKPDYTNLISTLIVVTNRRIYQMELKSSKNYYMPTVRWVYSQGITDTQSWQEYEEQKQLISVFTGLSPEYLSFDYKMSHSIFDKPVWLPKQVYDDGSKTYIVLDEQSLLMEFPLIFNDKKDIVNYRTEKNVIILDQLIEKVTLKLGKESVKIEKKKTDRDE